MREIQMDQKNQNLIVISPQKDIWLAKLIGEDQEAWKYYLHKGMVKEALKKTTDPLQHAQVAGIYAD